jgi:hypothetical protein
MKPLAESLPIARATFPRQPAVWLDMAAFVLPIDAARLRFDARGQVFTARFAIASRNDTDGR